MTEHSTPSKMTARIFSQSDGASSPPRPRINPWRKFVGSMIPNWLQCRNEINQGAKLAYARLAQYAGKDGECFPKQQTLAVELGVSERTANEYIRTLVKFRLIEKERPGLGLSNRYFFLDHPWMHEGRAKSKAGSGLKPQEASAPNQQEASGPDQQETSAPIKENQKNGESKRRENTHTLGGGNIPVSVDEAIAVARHLGIEEAFAQQEYHSVKSVDWKSGYGNQIVSWQDHLQARWSIEQRKRAERHARTPGRPSGTRRPSPRRQFAASDYNQSLDDF
jgi:hypothetical protein